MDRPAGVDLAGVSLMKPKTAAGGRSGARGIPRPRGFRRHRPP